MEFKITKEEQNPLFDRKEVIATIKSESIPKREEVIKYLSEKYSIPSDALRVLDIKGKFGDKEFTARGHVYSSKEERDKYEKLTKKEIAAEKPKPVEEKPEEKKEEPKPEEKPVVEVKEEPTPEEDKKEKDKSKEEKLNETELQA